MGDEMLAGIFARPGDGLLLLVDTRTVRTGDLPKRPVRAAFPLPRP